MEGGWFVSSNWMLYIYRNTVCKSIKLETKDSSVLLCGKVTKVNWWLQMDTSSMMVLVEQYTNRMNCMRYILKSQPLQLLLQMIMILGIGIFYQTNSSVLEMWLADVVISVESKMDSSNIKVGEDKSIS